MDEEGRVCKSFLWLSGCLLVDDRESEGKGMMEAGCERRDIWRWMLGIDKDVDDGKVDVRDGCS